MDLITSNLSLSLNLSDNSDQSSINCFETNRPHERICVFDEETFQLMKDRWKSEINTPSYAVCFITLIVGVLGNLCVVLAFCRCSGAASTMTNRYLGSLALADIMFLCVCVPCAVLRLYTTNWTTGLALCQWFNYVELLSATASIWHLIILGAERYIVIVHPLKARQYFTATNAGILLTAIWVFSVLTSLPAALSSRVYTDVLQTQTNVSDKSQRLVSAICVLRFPSEKRGTFHYAIYQLVVLFLIPLVLLAFFYVSVIRVLWFSTKKLEQMGGISQSCRTKDKTKAKRPKNGIIETRKQIILMLMLIIGSFMLFWGTKVISVVVLEGIKIMDRNLFSVNQEVILLFKSLAMNLPFIQSCLNPFIYAFMSRKFKRWLHDLLQRHCSRYVKSRRSLDPTEATEGLTMHHRRNIEKSSRLRVEVHNCPQCEDPDMSLPESFSVEACTDKREDTTEDRNPHSPPSPEIRHIGNSPICS